MSEYRVHGLNIEVAENFIYDEAVEPLLKLREEYHWVPRTVVDIGANAGSLALLAAKNGATRVLAVEPVLFDRLVGNIYKNSLERRVVPLPFAVRATNEPTPMRRVTTDGQVGHCYREGRAPIHCGTWPSITPAQLLGLLDGELDYLKVDIEGGEWELMETGALDPLLKAAHMLDLEIHGEGEFLVPGVTRDFDYVSYLRRFGFMTEEPDGSKRIVSEKELPSDD